MKNQVPLTDSDQKLLRKRLLQLLLFPVIVGAMITAFVVFFFSETNNPFTQDEIFSYVFAGFFIFFFGIIGYMLWSVIADMKRGFKYSIAGLVTNKRLDVRTTGGAGTKSRSRTTRHYYVSIDNQEYPIDQIYYGRVRTGQVIRLEKAPKSDMTLALEVLQEGPNQDEETLIMGESANNKVRWLNTNIEREYLTHDDLRVMQKKLRKYALQRLLFMAPFLFIIFSLVYSDLAGLLIILFPFFIIPLFQGVVILRRFSRYLRDRSHSYLYAYTTVVTDKVQVDSNRTKSKHRIVTTITTLDVDSQMYANLSIDDKLVLFKPKFGKEYLKIATMNEQPVYLV